MSSIRKLILLFVRCTVTVCAVLCGQLSGNSSRDSLNVNSSIASTDSIAGYLSEELSGQFTRLPGVNVLDYGIPGHWTRVAPSGNWHAATDARFHNISLRSPMYGHYNLNWIPQIVIENIQTESEGDLLRLRFEPAVNAGARKMQTQIRYGVGDYERETTEVMLRRPVPYGVSLEFAGRFASYPGAYGEENQRGRGLWGRLKKDFHDSWAGEVSAFVVKNSGNEIDQVNPGIAKWSQPAGRYNYQSHFLAASLTNKAPLVGDWIQLRAQMTKSSGRYRYSDLWNVSEGEDLYELEVTHKGRWKSSSTSSSIGYVKYHSVNDSLFDVRSGILTCKVETEAPYTRNILSVTGAEIQYDPDRETASALRHTINYHLKTGLSVWTGVRLENVSANWFERMYYSQAYPFSLSGELSDPGMNNNRERLKSNVLQVGMKYSLNNEVRLALSIFQDNQTLYYRNGGPSVSGDVESVDRRQYKVSHEFSGMRFQGDINPAAWCNMSCQYTQNVNPPEWDWVPFDQSGSFAIRLQDIHRFIRPFSIHTGIFIRARYFHSEYLLEPVTRLHRLRMSSMRGGDVFLLDIQGNLTIHTVTAWYQVSNIFNKNNAIIAGYPLPANVIRGGIIWNFLD